jgi:hypothetical protein
MAMADRSISRRRFSQLACSVGLGLGCARLAHADEYVLVVHPSVGQKETTLDRIRGILSLREGQWENGAPVVLVLPPRRSGPIVWIAEGLLRMPESTYRRLVLAQVFRGAAREPVATESLLDVAKAVASRRGAISALPRSAVPEDVVVLALRA